MSARIRPLAQVKENEKSEIALIFPAEADEEKPLAG